MDVPSLKIRGIKTIFEGLSTKDQNKLLIDLMNLAKVDSIIRPVRINSLSDDEINKRVSLDIYYSSDHFREKFDDWIYPDLAKEMTLIKKDYLDRCYNLYNLIESKSIGFSRLGGNIEVNAISPRHRYVNKFDETITHDVEDGFMEKKSLFWDTLLYYHNMDTFYICLHLNYMEFSIKIQFIDLCLNMIIRDDSIILVLFILGYLDPILDLEKCLIAKNEFYRLLGSEFSEEYKTQDELLLINQKRIEAFIRKEEMFDIITSISSRSEKELLSDSLVFVCLDIVMNDYGTFLMA